MHEEFLSGPKHIAQTSQGCRCTATDVNAAFADCHSTLAECVRASAAPRQQSVVAAQLIDEMKTVETWAQQIVQDATSRT